MSDGFGFRCWVIPAMTSLTAAFAVLAIVSSSSIIFPFAFFWKSSIATLDKIEPDSATAAFPFSNSTTLILFVPRCLAAPFVVWLSAARTIASLQTIPRIRVTRAFRLGFGQPNQFAAGVSSMLLPLIRKNGSLDVYERQGAPASRIHRGLIVGRLFHRVLDAPIIGHFFGRNVLGKTVKDYRHLPFPMLDVAIGEGKISALAVPIRRHVPPLIGRGIRHGRIAGIAKLSVKNRVFIFVNENK